MGSRVWKGWDWNGSSSYDLGAELRMHSLTVNCETFPSEEKVAVVVPVTCIEVTCSEAMLALSFLYNYIYISYAYLFSIDNLCVCSS